MQRLVSLSLLVVVALPLLSCGGGGGAAGSGEQNPVVFSETLLIDQAGGTIEDLDRGIRIVVPAGSLTLETEVTLEVRENQRSGFTPEGWTSNSNAIDVVVDPAAMAESGEIELHIPNSPLGTDQRALVLVTDDAEMKLPVLSTYETDVFVATITKSHFVDAGRSRGRAGGSWLGAVLVITEKVLSQPLGNIYVFEGGTFREPEPGEKMDPGCTAVLVHGINDTKQALVPLANYLLQSDIAPGGKPAYDAVWVYGYNWLAGIDGSGQDFASDFNEVVGTGKVDVWGHSMGGLVARWAIEKEGLGDDVRQLYTLGTPHDGLPFKEAVHLLSYLLGVPLTDGLEDLLEESTFLNDLNGQASPYKDTTKYFTLCGYSWNGLFSPLGWLYSKYDIENDSVVPVYSAQSYVLQDKSQYWADNVSAIAEVFLNHSDLRSTGSSVSMLVRDVLQDEDSNWLEPCDHGSGEWTVINLHPTWAANSIARGVGGGKQVGDDDYHAVVWSGSAGSAVDLHPEGATGGSIAYGSANGQQVGRVYIGGHRASLWSGSAASWVDLNPPGASQSGADGIGDGKQVGGATFGGTRHAGFWTGTANSWVDLHPVGSIGSGAVSAGDGQQVGNAYSGSRVHAALWSGSAASYIDLHPAEASYSSATGVSDGQQVGYGVMNGTTHAFLWIGSAASFVDLNPSGSTSAQAFAVDEGQQAGYAYFSGFQHAGVWSGSAASWIDLHAYLPSIFTDSMAKGIWHDANSTYVVGYAGNFSTGHKEAVMWVKTD